MKQEQYGKRRERRDSEEVFQDVEDVLTSASLTPTHRGFFTALKKFFRTFTAFRGLVRAHENSRWRADGLIRDLLPHRHIPELVVPRVVVQPALPDQVRAEGVDPDLGSRCFVQLFMIFR